jgi:hypothetical protein
MKHTRRSIVLSVALAIVSAASPAADQRDLMKELGLRQGQRYASAKAALLKRGWTVDRAHAKAREPGQGPPYGFNEVVCGQGWDAICSARFVRRGREMMLMMKPKTDLLVDGASDD